jgi:hypothetical protein
MTARELEPVAAQLETRLATNGEVASLRSVIRDGVVREVLRARHDLDALDSAVRGELDRAASALPPQVRVHGRWRRGYPVGGYVITAPDAESLAAGVRRIETALATVPAIAVTTCGEPVVQRVIEVDGARLAAAGGTIAEVIGAIDAAAPGTLPPGIADVATVRDELAPAACAAIDGRGRRAALVEISVGTPRGLSDTAVAVVRAVREARAALPAGVDIAEAPRDPPQSVGLAVDDVSAALAALHGAAPSALIEAGTIGDHVRSARLWGASAAAVRALPVVAAAGVPRGEIVIESNDRAAVAAAARSLAHERHDVVALYGVDERRIERVRIDREAAASHGVSPALSAIAASLASGATIRDGIVLVARAPDVALAPDVRLDQIATVDRELAPVELVRVSAQPAAIVLVSGSPRCAGAAGRRSRGGARRMSRALTGCRATACGPSRGTRRARRAAGAACRSAGPRRRR